MADNITDSIDLEELAAERQSGCSLDWDCDKIDHMSEKPEQLQGQIESLTNAINDLSNKMEAKESKSILTWSAFKTTNILGRWFSYPSVNVGVKIREKRNYCNVKLETVVQVPNSFFVSLNMLKAIPLGYFADGACYVGNTVRNAGYCVGNAGYVVAENIGKTGYYIGKTGYDIGETGYYILKYIAGAASNIVYKWTKPSS